MEHMLKVTHTNVFQMIIHRSNLLIPGWFLIAFSLFQIALREAINSLMYLPRFSNNHKDSADYPAPYEIAVSLRILVAALYHSDGR